MNTAIGFKIGSLLDNGWVPNSEFVEVVVSVFVYVHFCSTVCAPDGTLEDNTQSETGFWVHRAYNVWAFELETTFELVILLPPLFAVYHPWNE